MSSAGSYGGGGSGMSGVLTITGDTGLTVTGNVTLTGLTLGSGIVFNGTSGTALQTSIDYIAMSDATSDGAKGFVGVVGSGTIIAPWGGIASGNMFICQQAGASALTGQQNIGIGQQALTQIQDANNNIAIGYQAAQGCQSLTDNVAIGYQALATNGAFGATGVGGNVAVGSNALRNGTAMVLNIAIGDNAGLNYTGSESSNILIGNEGVLAENNTIRIGTDGSTPGEQDTCYIAGIYGTTGVTATRMATVDSDGLMGSAVLPASAIATLTGNTGGAVGPDGLDNIDIVGSGAISVTGNPGTHTLTVALSGAVVTTYETDTANVVPTANTLNLFGGTGISTASSANTVTFNLETPVTIANGGTNATSMTNTFGVNYYDGTRIVTTTVGTAGNVLTSNGAGVAPTFQASAGGGVTSITGDTGTAQTGALNITGGTSGALFDTSASNITESFHFLAMSDTNNPLTTGYIQIGANPILMMAGGVGNGNPCFGDHAGNAAMSGADNTLIGSNAGHAITSASTNTFIGAGAGQVATSSANNTGVGGSALFNLLTGSGRNSAFGLISLENLTTGSDNIGIGVLSGSTYNGAESNNIVIGNAGVNGESNVLRIGTTGAGTRQQNQTFIAGIAGTTVANSAAVLIDTVSEQLGTVPSSRRYKENIHDISEDSHKILNLRPVEFTYKKDESHTKQFGLIAEEVEEVFPYLVAYNKDGQPETVKYHELPTLLLAEIQRLEERIKSLEEQFAARVR